MARPGDLLCAVAMATDQIGLAATVSTTYSHPWEVTRRLATLDFISHGRAGWNILTTVEPALANFGDVVHPDRAAPLPARRRIRPASRVRSATLTPACRAAVIRSRAASCAANRALRSLPSMQRCSFWCRRFRVRRSCSGAIYRRPHGPNR
jgi:hypothetical protein